MASVDKKLLRDLPIHDIKTELAKRNVDTTGIKSVLTERLKKALVDEGEDPNVFQFDVSKVANNEVSQAGDNVGGAGGHGQDVGEENDDFDEENPGNDNEDLNSTAGSQRSPSAAKPGTTTPAKGKKNQSSTVREGGDDSFVLQEDDNVMSDIDADLLEGKAGGLREAGDNNGDTNNSGQDNSAATDTSANLVENSDSKDDNTTSGSKDENDTKTMAKSSTATATDEKSAQPGRNLWVSGLSYRVRAADLKTLFSKHGKVVAAKIVTSSRTAVARYFGLVTMSTDEEATKCAQLLHRRDLLGRIISVEKAKTETQGTETKILPPSALKPPARPPYRARRPGPNPADKKEGEQPTTPSGEKTELSETEAKDVVSFSKIKADQEQERLRRKEMFLEREKYKQHMIEKRHREEAFRIDRERRRLREMREELERQHIETERMRLETERLHMEREQEKYRREQQRVLQARRALKRRGPRDEEWPTKRFHGGDRYESAQGQREFNRRGDEPRTFREERPNRPNNARGPPRHHESRSEWKSEREVRTGGWNGPVDHSKGEEEWDAGNIGQGDGWDNDGMNQSASGYGLQQGQMSGAGAGYIAQPSMQGGMMQGNRQNDGRYGMSAASSRRF